VPVVTLFGRPLRQLAAGLHWIVTRGLAEYPLGVEPDADIPIVFGYLLLLEHKSAGFDNILAILAPSSLCESTICIERWKGGGSAWT
jgi:hypothetical protein